MNAAQFGELQTRLALEEKKLEQSAQAVSRVRAHLSNLFKEGHSVEPEDRARLARARETEELQTELVTELRKQVAAETPSADALKAGHEALAAYQAAPAALIADISSELAELAKLDAKRNQIFAKIAKKGEAFDQNRAAQRKTIDAAKLGLPIEEKVNAGFAAPRRPEAIDFAATALPRSEYVFGLPVAVFERCSWQNVTKAPKLRSLLAERESELAPIKASLSKDPK